MVQSATPRRSGSCNKGDVSAEVDGKDLVIPVCVTPGSGGEKNALRLPEAPGGHSAGARETPTNSAATVMQG